MVVNYPYPYLHCIDPHRPPAAGQRYWEVGTRSQGRYWVNGIHREGWYVKKRHLLFTSHAVATRYVEWCEARHPARWYHHVQRWLPWR
jgi:hypothetical protein